MAKTIGLVVLGVLALGFGFIGLLYMTRGSPINSVRAVGDKTGMPPISDPQFVRVAALLASTNLQQGNHLEILTNGSETYPRLWEDLKGAKHSITLQMYYCNSGKMATMLKDILIERSKAGVRILFLHDAFGSSGLTKEYFDSLDAGGIQATKFRPVKWYSLHKAQSRSHIRIVVIDGAIAYTGGFGLDDKWFGDGRHDGQWRDTNVRFSGPAVMQHQATFVAGWAEATGQLIAGDIFFPPAGFRQDGNQLATAMHAAPTLGSTAAERFLALSIASARSKLYITNSYFVPDDDFRLLLTDAAKRGVDVRVLTAGEKSDAGMVWRAGRARYEELLEGGVKVYEYQPSMMHAKTLVVDGLWGTVGTMNFDNRSLVLNDESNLVALDREFGAALEKIYLDDLEYSKEMKLEEFRQRPWTGKITERLATLLSRLM
ncbi:MAG: cardiolipin synthase [Gemmatimonadaceae bacterium]